MKIRSRLGSTMARPILGVLFLAVVLAAAERPNVVVFLADDQGWGDLSSSGNTNLSTPKIDSLARDGASFDRFFVCPVCSPTRAEYLTGRYHPRGGVYSTSAGGERLDLDETTIADVFKEAGYATAAFGKWHNGTQYPYHPNGRGFDEFYGFCSGHWGNYFSPPLDHNGQIVRGHGFVIDDFTDHALKFITDTTEEGKRPFFVYLPYNTPHSPMQVPDRWWKKFASKELALRHRDPSREDVAHTRAALAMCENIDWNVGRILERLNELEIADETIVVYFTDNGPNGFRWNGGMKGRKGSTDEGGVRSPLYVRWPAKIKAGTRVSRIAAAIDLLPTLADLAEVDLPQAATLDGVSLEPLLLGQSDAAGERSWPERMIFSHWNRRVSVRTDRYRLDHAGGLFDMIADPGQSRNIASERSEIAARLREAVSKWQASVLAELQRGGRPFIVGHSDFELTQLPARDGRAHGGIRRSNRFPNCSYFENWRTLEDSITWDVEVAAGGRFEVEVYYACPEDSVGSTIELAFDEATLRRKVTEPHAPPVRGAEHDRVPRKESYVKDFRPLRLGTIELPAGRGLMTLRAVEIAGPQVMELRTMMLKRLGAPVTE